MTYMTQNPKLQNTKQKCKLTSYPPRQGRGEKNSNNKYFQFWQQDNHPIELYGYEALQQKLNYLHENPVRAGIVYESWHYKYSSAIDYCTTEKGKIDIEPA